MEDIKKRIEAIVQELHQELTNLSKNDDYSHIKPKAHPPATEDQIEEYEKHLGHSLPPSYRAFLELYNGYDWLAYPGHMLSIEDVMPRGRWYEDIVEWKKTSARYGSGEVLDGIVIGNLGNMNNWVYLDPNRSVDGELVLVEWEPEDSDEYPTLVEFLEECLEVARAGSREEDEG
jgi:cell wall assembly regulator SMI1